MKLSRSFILQTEVFWKNGLQFSIFAVLLVCIFQGFKKIAKLKHAKILVDHDGEEMFKKGFQPVYPPFPGGSILPRTYPSPVWRAGSQEISSFVH